LDNVDIADVYMMAERTILILLALVLVTWPVYGQETSYGPGYQTVMLNNPAFTGAEGDGTIRLSYLNFYPGHNFNFQSVFVSYDTYVPAMHGGAGIFLTDDYLGGIVNDLRGGISYAYHLQANERLFINAGLTASIYYRGFNNSAIILPDQIDPLSGLISASGETISQRGRAVFDIGTGIMIMSDRFIAGLALNHLATPDIEGSGLERDKLKRKIILNLAGRFGLGNNPENVVRPIVFTEYQGNNLNGGVGASLENNSLSISAVLLSNSARDIDMQAGCSLKKGKLMVFYNYRFNITSGNKMLPFSLIHQTGLALSLNYVDKRNAVKAINYPKL
jgi:type IX secretion system PorP/SprF family membrane protein